MLFDHTHRIMPCSVGWGHVLEQANWLTCVMQEQERNLSECDPKVWGELRSLNVEPRSLNVQLWSLNLNLHHEKEREIEDEESSFPETATCSASRDLDVQKCLQMIQLDTQLPKLHATVSIPFPTDLCFQTRYTLIQECQ